MVVDKDDPVRHESADLDEEPLIIDNRQPVVGRKLPPTD
jgi:hypothetical protein